MKLLIDEHPLTVLPGLAKEIGLNEAIVLQQIHYWTRDSRHVIDGHSWTYNSVEEWQKQFPFWSNATIRRVVDSLVEKRLLLKRKLSPNRFDATLWYAVNTTELSAKCEQIDLLKMSKWSAQNEQIRSAQSEQITSTETTKTTTETTPMSGKPDDADSPAGILAYLNEQAGREFQPVKANLDRIASRLKEGFTPETIRDVIRMKVKEWKGTKFEQYLRPETLFGATKFAGYAGQRSMILRKDEKFDPLEYVNRNNKAWHGDKS